MELHILFFFLFFFVFFFVIFNFSVLEMKSLFVALITAVIPFGILAQDDDWCHSQGPNATDDFTAALFVLYGDGNNCTMTRQGILVFHRISVRILLYKLIIVKV